MGFPVAAAIAAGASLLGQGGQMAATSVKNKKQYKRSLAIMDKQYQMNQEMALFNQRQQMKMWEDTGPVGQMKQLDKAGLNPGLIYGMGGAGGQTVNAAEGSGVSAGSAEMENAGAGLAQTGQIVGQQLALMKAQKENIEADTAIKTAEAEYTTGIKTEIGKGEAVAKEYAGKEAKSEFEKVSEPNRGVKQKTLNDEMEARQGVALTLRDMYEEGKLHEKSLAEIHGLLLKNAKTEAEKNEVNSRIKVLNEQEKGLKLDNVIKEIEARLQETTGLDKNSNEWARMVGRLLMKYILN